MIDENMEIILTAKQAKPFKNMITKVLYKSNLILDCRNIWCGADLSNEPIFGRYEPDDGDEIEGLEGRWHLFIRCPKCENEYSLNRLFRITKTVSLLKKGDDAST